MDEGSQYGNRISLISKSGFRYVGILKDVDEERQTISLVQVRSMGTEGRKQDPKEEVPPLNEIYEFVQFRATDVTSVQFESELEPQQPTLPQDPAIVEANTQQPSSEPSYSQIAQSSNTTTLNVPPANKADATSAQPNHSKADDNKQVSTRTVSDNAPTAAAVPEVTNSVESKVDENRDSAENQAKNQQHPNRSANHNQRGGRGDQRRGRGDSYQRGQGRRYNYRGQLISIPASDFDFQESNSKFDKSEIIKEFTQLTIGGSETSENVSSVTTANTNNTKAAPPVAENQAQADSAADAAAKKPENYYDKTKSFFDDISCEIKERATNTNSMSQPMRREKANIERRHNLETFGVANAAPNYGSYHRNTNRYNNRGRGGYSQSQGHGHGQNQGQGQGQKQGYRPRRNQQNSNYASRQNSATYEQELKQPVEGQ